jgi:hypothetical protein
MEALLLNFSSWFTEAYTAPFSMDELLVPFQCSGNTSPGPDGIHNFMLSHLSQAGREFLLSMYNRL